MDGSGWIELQKSASLATFGLPMNGFGLVAQVNVEKQGPSWNVVAAKPCFLTVSTPGSVVVPVYKPKSGFGNPADPTLDLAKADELTACGGPSPQFKVVETARSISVLATYPWDVQKQQVVGANTQPCGGTVEVKQFAIKLKKPLGSRKIIQSGYVPVRPVGDLGTPQPAPLGYRQ